MLRLVFWDEAPEYFQIYIRGCVLPSSKSDKFHELHRSVFSANFSNKESGTNTIQKNKLAELYHSTEFLLWKGGICAESRSRNARIVFAKGNKLREPNRFGRPANRNQTRSVPMITIRRDRNTRQCRRTWKVLIIGFFRFPFPNGNSQSSSFSFWSTRMRFALAAFYRCRGNMIANVWFFIFEIITGCV